VVTVPPPPDPSVSKAEAELDKLRREISKLDKEIAAILPAHLVERKAQAELSKLERERDKIDREIHVLAHGPWLEPAKMFSSLLLALVAVAGLWVSVETARRAADQGQREAQRSERELVSTLIRDLSAEQPGLRATAAGRLGTYIGTPMYRSSAVASLISAVGFESEDLVQGAIMRALAPAGTAAGDALRDARSMLDGDIAPLFSDVDPTTGILREATARKIDARQQALIKIALALASDQHCEAIPCRPEFAGIQSLRRSRFISYSGRLKQANFRGATLSEADFFEADLSGADFERADVDAAVFSGAVLAGAKFDGANMRALKEGDRVKYALFKGADLAGASFVDACLGGADFTGSRNLDLAAVARGFTAGLRIEPDKLAGLGTPRSSPRCLIEP
jgi:hypothetical protein